MSTKEAKTLEILHEYEAAAQERELILEEKKRLHVLYSEVDHKLTSVNKRLEAAEAAMIALLKTSSNKSSA